MSDHARRLLMDLATASAVETAKAVADRSISALEVCDAAIARIEERDVDINAVVVRDFERARAAATAIDADRSSQRDKPLLGVAMTVKESNDVAGLPTTWGFPWAASIPVRADSVAVRRLKDAGVVILGKTNAPVALGDWQATNPIYGRTVNPHDHTRSPGGSSGGAAAALAANMVPLELGSDIGGSIRVPANFCGVYGHKPTYGIVPLAGHSFPGSDGVDVELAVVGPMARTPEDLATALDVIAGPADLGYRLDLLPVRHPRLRDHRVLVLDTHPSCATSNETRDALLGLAGSLERAGCSVVRAHSDLPDLDAAHASYQTMLGAITSRGAPDGPPPISAEAWMDLLDIRMRAQRSWKWVFGDVDVVIAPSFGIAAYPHDDAPFGERVHIIDGVTTPYGAQLAWPGVATFPGLPATAVPITHTAEGLPLGVQIIGPRFADHVTIAFAALLAENGLAVSL